MDFTAYFELDFNDNSTFGRCVDSDVAHEIMGEDDED